MLAFPEMIVEAAYEAGIEVPNNFHDYDKDKYPHWFVFCQMQLGQPMPNPNSHWENAKVIAAIPDDQIKTVTPEQLCELGLQTGASIP